MTERQCARLESGSLDKTSPSSILGTSAETWKPALVCLSGLNPVMPYRGRRGSNPLASANVAGKDGTRQSLAKPDAGAAGRNCCGDFII